MRRLVRRPASAVLIAVALGVAVAVLARLVLGPRGAIVPDLFFVLYPAGVTGFIGVRWLRGARDPNLSATNRRILAVMGLVPLGAAVFFAVQSGLLLLDLVLPFETVPTRVAAIQQSANGRGPSTDHLVIADGPPFAFPLFVLPPDDVLGERTIELSHFQHLVIEVR